MIDSYDFGHMVINGREYNHDVIVYNAGITLWQRENSHNVSIEDLNILPKGIDIFVMGNGYSGVCMFPGETKKFLESKGVEVIVQITGRAYKTFNKLVEEGKNVCGGFHLTC